MAIVDGYATLEEFQAWSQVVGLGKTDQMELAVTVASRAIDDYCQRHFYQENDGVAAAKTFEVIDCRVMKLGPFRDLVSLTSLKSDAAGDGTFETTWSASEYELGPVNRAPGRPYTRVTAIAGRNFPVYYGTGRYARVEITGVWGWAAVPPEVNQACLIKAARLVTRMQSPNGVAGLDQFGPVRVSRFEDPDVVMLLDPYRHPAAVALVA